MPERPIMERWTPEPGNAFEAGIWAGAEADYDDWRRVGPVELPPLAEADPYIAWVFIKRARLILAYAVDEMERMK